MKRAFSLVELSVVLVVIGLLVGGIIAGKSLIRAAKVRSVVTDYQAWESAADIFQDTYLGIPGDLVDATDYWGSAGGSGDIGDGCESASGTGTQTCNGNGDRLIAAASAGSRYGEMFTFWQHLANAGLIGGDYTGTSGGNANDANVGVNVPESKLAAGGWSILYRGTDSGGSWTFAGEYGNALMFGADRNNAPSNEAILTPKEAWSIDKKIDDGMPGQGKVWALWWDTCTDAATHGGSTVSDRDNAEYLLSDGSILCAFFFRNFP